MRTTDICRFAILVLWGSALGAQPSASADLRGAIDIHVHSFPDSRPRSLDALEAVRQAKAAGMRAIVLKNHYESTASWAYLVRQAVPGIEVFGGVALNRAVGGINIAAVDYMTAQNGGYGRVVWMPTFDAENDARFHHESRPVVPVSQHGELLGSVKAVIRDIASHNLVLATGHSSPAEGLMLLREGRTQGVTHMVVTHATSAPVLMTVPQMQEAASLGAFIEIVGSNVRDSTAPARLRTIVEAINGVGAEHCILSSDLGQQGNPLPAEGFAAFIAELRKRGISDSALATMTRRNPARLLGLE